MHQWELRDNPVCNCGNVTQTFEHIVIADCPKRKSQGEINDFFKLTREALDWIVSLDISL